MGIDDIPAVNDEQPLSSRWGLQKFLLFEVAHGGERKKIVWRINTEPGSKVRHAQIIDRLVVSFPPSAGFTKSVLGGGFLCFLERSGQKMLKVTGQSEDYKREADRDETVRILKGHFPGFEVVAED